MRLSSIVFSNRSRSATKPALLLHSPAEGRRLDWPNGCLAGNGLLPRFGCYPMGDGLQRCSLSIATRPQPSQTNVMAVNLLLHMWAWLMSGAPQNEHFWRSPQGSHRWPGSLATAPHRLQVWAIFSLLMLRPTQCFFYSSAAHRHRLLILKRNNVALGVVN